MRIILAHNFTTDSYAMESVAIAESLAKSGNEVLFISHNPQFHTDYFPFPNCKVVSWPSPRPVDLKSIRYYYKLHRAFKPDVVLAHFAATIPCGIGGWLLRCPSRITVYHTAEEANIIDINQSGWKNRLGRLKRKWLYNLYHKVVCVSHFAFNDIQTYFKVPPSKLCVIHHGINDRFIKVTGKKTSPVKIGYLGRLDKAKQILEIIAIFKLLISKNKLNIELEIAGDGTLRTLVESAVKGEEKIKYLGKLPYKEIDNFILNQHFMILPTLAETFGYVILESIMLGIPVIASEIGGIPEIINNKENGLLFDPKNQPHIIQTILDAAELVESKKLDYQKMCDNCRTRFSDQFRLSNTVKQYLAILSSTSN